MQVEKNKVVSIHYRVTDNTGELVDSSHERGEPLPVLIGYNAIVPGLENALLGRSAGERFEITVPPADAYGERGQDNIQRVPKKYFKDGARLRPGMTTVLSLREGGQRMVTVQKVGMSVIDVDLNHPLAGKDLNFEVEVVSVRDADSEELAHRHAHGPGGHHA